MSNPGSSADSATDAYWPGASALERKAELDAVVAWLIRREPAVLSIVGQRGSGKSFVTDAVVRQAIALGWQVTPYRDGRGIRVGSGTTEHDLATDVASALEISVPRSGRRLLRTLAQSLADVSERSPILVVLDPFAPDDTLLEHVGNDFLRTVRASEAPVVVLIVCRRSLDGTIPLDFELPVAIPTEDSVRSSLAAVVNEAGLDLLPGELDAYVAAAGRSPRLLTSLLAVLPYGDQILDEAGTAAS